MLDQVFSFFYAQVDFKYRTDFETARASCNVLYVLMRQNETVHKMNHPLCASISPCEQGWDDDMENARSDIIPEIV